MALEYIACIFQRFSKRQHAIEYKKKTKTKSRGDIFSQEGIKRYFWA
jgi:hypothetical protein